MQNERLFAAAQTNKQASEALLCEIRERTAANHALESEYRVNETNILHTTELQAAAEGAAASARKSVDDESASAALRTAKITELEARLESQRAEHEATERELAAESERERSLELDIARALDDIHVLESEAVDIKARRSVIERAKLSDTDKHTAMITQISEYEKLSSEMQMQISAAERTVGGYRSSGDECDGEITRLDGALTDLYVKKQLKKCYFKVAEKARA